MAIIVVKTLDKSVAFPSMRLDALRGGLRGGLSLPGWAEYEARRVADDGEVPA